MRLTLNKLFKFTDNDGIFTYLNTYDVPWKNDVDVDILDLDYHTKFGTRIIGKPVQVFLTEDGLSTQNKQKLAKLIYNKNKVKWDELYSSLSLYDDFNPLDNTNWTEEERIEHRGSDSKTYNIGQKSTTFSKGQQVNNSNKGAQINNTNVGAQTFTEGAQSNSTGAQSNTSEDSVSAFNVSTYSNKDKNTQSLGARTDSIGEKINSNSSRSDSMTEGARQDSYTDGARQDTNIEGAQTNSESGSDNFTDIHTIHRAGNIGITSSGQLIDDFRRIVNWQFFDIVYKDINDVLVLDVYGDEREDLDDYTFITDYVLPIASALTLGGIKVGQNLTIDSDGTLNAQAGGGGAVDSVNGKTGVVTLDASDVGAASSSALESLALVVGGNVTDIGALQTALAAIKQVPSGGDLGQVLQKLAEGYGWADILQVPSGGSQGQVLTKGSSGYSWQNPAGGSGEKTFMLQHKTPTAWGGQHEGNAVAFKWDSGITKVMVSNIHDLRVDQQLIFNINSVLGKWEQTYLTNICNEGRLVFDDKLGIIFPFSPNSNANGNKMASFGDVAITTTNLNYTNIGVGALTRSYVDTANIVDNINLNINIGHILIAHAQYAAYTSNPLSVTYTDANDIVHDITAYMTLKTHALYDDKFVALGYDINDYVKTLTISSPTGYRYRTAVAYEMVL